MSPGRYEWGLLLLLLLSRFSRVRLCTTPSTAAHQAPQSLGFSRQEHWSGFPFPSTMHEKWKVKVKSFSRVWLLATPWTAAYQAPPSMGFSRQEYWSGVPLPSPIIGYTWPLLHSPSPSVKNQTFIEHLYAALLEVGISKWIRQTRHSRSLHPIQRKREERREFKIFKRTSISYHTLHHIKNF